MTVATGSAPTPSNPVRAASLALRYVSTVSNQPPAAQVSGFASPALWAAPDAASFRGDVCYLPLSEQPTVELVQGKVVLLDAVFAHTFLPRVMECQRLGATGVIVAVGAGVL